MRDAFQDLFRFKKEAEYGLRVMAKPADVDAYETGLHTGPLDDDLRIDVMNQFFSGWNDEVIRIIYSRILAKLKKDALPDKLSESYRTFIGNKLHRVKTHIRKLLPRDKEEGRKESTEEISARCVLERAEKAKGYRQDTRRRTVSQITGFSPISIHSQAPRVPALPSTC